jgi:hypothetical protein
MAVVTLSHNGPESAGRPDGIDRDPAIERGLAVLQELARDGSPPGSIAEERDALETLARLGEHTQWTGMLAARHQSLLGQLQSLRRLEVHRLLQRLEPPLGRMERSALALHPALARSWRLLRDRWSRFDASRPRNSRARLMFVLLATTSARVYQYAVLRALVEEKVLGGPAKLDTLLDWTRRPCRRAEDLGIARAYLRLVRDELFAPADRGPDERLTAAEFARWPWVHRILALEARRHEYRDAGDPPNPAHRAGTLEFELARRGEFGRLARAGGLLASTLLRDLDYGDAVSARPWPVRTAVLALLLALTALSIGALVVKRVRAWDEEGARLATEAIAHTAASPDEAARMRP